MTPPRPRTACRPAKARFFRAASGLPTLMSSAGARRTRSACSISWSRLCNDVGLLAEEYDIGAQRLLGNFPQAFSHIALVNTALISSCDEACEQRSGNVRLAAVE